LDGIYTPGEVYLRWFQRGSALAFGTRVGRFITRYLAVPVGGAYIVIEFLQHMLHALVKKLFGYDLHIVSIYAVAILGIYFLSLLYVPRVRTVSWQVLNALGRGLWRLFVTLPWLIYPQ